MDISLWIAFSLSILFLVLCFPVVALIPDTCISIPRGGVFNQEQAQASSSDPGVFHRDRRMQECPERLMDVPRNSNMILAIPVFLIGLLRPSTLNVLIQYTSKYFDWRLSQAIMFVSEVAGINLLLYLIIVPKVMQIIREKYGLHQQMLDLAVVRGSMGCLSIGALLIALAPNIPALVIGNMHVRK